MEPVIETQHLTKRFEQPQGLRRLASVRPITAVQDVSLTVEAGELFGLLGPNGAGKTTLVKMLSTLILPTSGEARIAGFSLAQPGAIRAAVGLVVADERSFYWRLSGRQNLLFFAAMYRLFGREAQRRVDEVLAAVDMVDRADGRFSNYSTGMKQRLAIARSLLHRPGLLFLDEPSRSLDPVATQRLHGLIRSLIERQKVTIFLITHDLVEAEKLCQRVAVMYQGQVQVVGRPVELRQQLARQIRYVVRVDQAPPDPGRVLPQLLPDLVMEPGRGDLLLKFRASETDGSLNRVLDLLREQQVHIYSIEGAPPSLEEVFTHFTGGSDAPPHPQETSQP